MGDIDSAFWVRPFQIMEWSTEASLALIDEYRNHPMLWDVKHQLYCSKSHKQEAWEAIAMSMQMDVQEVKQKMNSLLGSFRREKSKIRKSMERSNGKGGGYCSRWFAFEKMQFLLRGESGAIEVKFEEDEDSIFEELGYPIEDSLEVMQGDKRTSNMYGSPSKRAKKCVKPIPDPLCDDLSIFPPQDEYSAFGQYVACKLRRFDHRTRSFVEHAINNVLFEADMGKFDNTPSPFASNQQNWQPTTSHPNQLVSDPISASPPLNNITNRS